MKLCKKRQHEIGFGRNQLWNCTHFRHPTDKRLRQLDNYRSRTSDRGLSSPNHIPEVLKSLMFCRHQ